MLGQRATIIESAETSEPPAKVGVIVSIQICTAHREPMQKLATVRLIENRGLQGDRHARADSSRQVLLIEVETLERFGLGAGDVKENLTTRGIELKSLKRGTRLQIGAVLLEITKPCTPCSRMDELRMGLQQELQDQRGMLARVICGGAIRVNDTIQVVGTE